MLLVSTFAVAAVSAIVPLVNIEVYLGVVATQLDVATHPARLVLLAATAGVAQALGKLCWYLLAARSMECRWVQHKLSGTRRHRFDVWHARIVGRPWLSAGVLAVSAVVGLPPLLILSVVAGSVRVPLGLFVPTVVVGRTVRFWAILAGVGAALGG